MVSLDAYLLALLQKSQTLQQKFLESCPKLSIGVLIGGRNHEGLVGCEPTHMVYLEQEIKDFLRGLWVRMGSQLRI